MLTKIKESLLILDEQLQILWSNYLKSRPLDWLHNLEDASTQLAEEGAVFRALTKIHYHTSTAREILTESPDLDPLRKET